MVDRFFCADNKIQQVYNKKQHHTSMEGREAVPCRDDALKGKEKKAHIPCREPALKGARPAWEKAKQGTHFLAWLAAMLEGTGKKV